MKHNQTLLGTSCTISSTISLSIKKINFHTIYSYRKVYQFLTYFNNAVVNFQLLTSIAFIPFLQPLLFLIVTWHLFLFNTRYYFSLAECSLWDSVSDIPILEWFEHLIPLFFFSRHWSLFRVASCPIHCEAFPFDLGVQFLLKLHRWQLLLASLPLLLSQSLTPASYLWPDVGWLPCQFSAWDFVCLFEEDSITSCPKHSKGRVCNTNSQGRRVYLFIFLMKGWAGNIHKIHPTFCSDSLSWSQTRWPFDYPDSVHKRVSSPLSSQHWSCSCCLTPDNTYFSRQLSACVTLPGSWAPLCSAPGLS